MNGRTMLLGAIFSITLSLSGYAAIAYNVGDVVEVQPSMMKNPAKGMWYRAKISVVRPDGGLNVIADDGTEYLIWPDPPLWIRPASSSTPGSASGATPGMTQRPVGVFRSRSSLPSGISTKGNTLSVQPNSASAPQSASSVLPAKGAPPDGEYNCMKISGSSLIHLGTLEIRGGTYRGLTKDGGFSPLSISGAGNITWSQGLRGMPDGWKVYDSRYVGGDEHGRPLMKIYYRSKNGWNDMFDALKER